MADFYQRSLLDIGAAVEIGPLAPRRTMLASGAWVDVLPGWVRGSDDLFLRLEADVPWRAERREMYDRMVDVPRLVCHYGVDDELPDPMLTDARERLGDHYAAELGDRFVTAGMCLYRDGRDSVAWHGDRIGRGRSHDTMVAIVSLGASRRLSLRPRDGGPQTGFALGHGDLVVMGGSCQRTYDHAVLKTARPVGPRISIQFRPRNVL
ncbi:MAG: alpha-ketoglutarate-dependent dioxygenase AlkB [Aeromicrobium sp.]|nr:alpha-ketoglutarate-dependent dioxygenase AlkB [Aeromicrobium sp.]